MLSNFDRIYFNDDTDNNVRDLIYSHVFCNDPIHHKSGKQSLQRLSVDCSMTDRGAILCRVAAQPSAGI